MSGIDNPESITLENVHSLSVYALRQELTRRAAVTPELEARFSYRTALEALVSILAREREDAYRDTTVEKAIVAEGSGETLQESLRRRKEERKRAALERSRQRQQDPHYFRARQSANEEHRKEDGEDAAGKIPDTDSGAGADPADEEPLFAQRRAGMKVHVRA